MSGFEKMDALLRANTCDWDAVLTEMHSLFLLWGFQELCHRMNQSDRLKNEIRATYRRKSDNVAAARVIARTYLGLELPAADAVWLNRCLLAYFSKGTCRADVGAEQKRRRLAEQGGVCACCGRPISLQSGEYDHIIPWELVGDLEENGQMLCVDCNRSKSNSVDYMAKRLLLKPVCV